jgi:hypothetical protein
MLTLWNVKMSDPSILTDLPELWWLGIRGGSDRRLDWIAKLSRLRFLEIWHAYKLESVDFIRDMELLQGLHFHALPWVGTFPNMRERTSLRHVWLGQMKRLEDVGPLLCAPNLERFLVDGQIQVSNEAIEQLRAHQKLREVLDLRYKRPSLVELSGKARAKVVFRHEWDFHGLTETQFEELQCLRAETRRQKEDVKSAWQP